MPKISVKICPFPSQIFTATFSFIIRVVISVLKAQIFDDMWDNKYIAPASLNFKAEMDISGQNVSAAQHRAKEYSVIVFVVK
jgi:hypothetical protein